MFAYETPYRCFDFSDVEADVAIWEGTVIFWGWGGGVCCVNLYPVPVDVDVPCVLFVVVAADVHAEFLSSDEYVSSRALSSSRSCTTP